MSAMFGMTFVFTPALHMFGENVVWVFDHSTLASVFGSLSIDSSTLTGSISACLTPGSRSSEPTKPRHSSSTYGDGR